MSAMLVVRAQWLNWGTWLRKMKYRSVSGIATEQSTKRPWRDPFRVMETQVQERAGWNPSIAEIDPRASKAAAQQLKQANANRSAKKRARDAKRSSYLDRKNTYLYVKLIDSVTIYIDLVDYERRRNKKVVRRILDSYEDGEMLNLVDYARIAALVSRHPLYEEIMGIGAYGIKGYHGVPAAIRVRLHPLYGRHKCFFVVRPDGTEVMVSYKQCQVREQEDAIQMILAEAARTELEASGTWALLKKTGVAYRKSNPGMQVSFQLKKTLERFAIVNHLRISTGKQLLAIVRRNSNHRWEIFDDKLRAAWRSYVNDAISAPLDSDASCLKIVAYAQRDHLSEEHEA